MRLPPLEEAYTRRSLAWSGAEAWTKTIAAFFPCKDVPQHTGNIAALTAARAWRGLAIVYPRPDSRSGVVFFMGRHVLDFDRTRAFASVISEIRLALVDTGGRI